MKPPLISPFSIICRPDDGVLAERGGGFVAVKLLWKLVSSWWDSPIPIPSMFGIFTNIYHKKSTKCRQIIYHTWMVWDMLHGPCILNLFFGWFVCFFPRIRFHGIHHRFSPPFGIADVTLISRTFFPQESGGFSKRILQNERLINSGCRFVSSNLPR